MGPVMQKLMLAAGLIMVAQTAAALVCTATEQCRGDARTMCAPSSLRIELDTDGRLWIDRQGPYTARAAQQGAATHWSVEAFGGTHRLELAPDGRFLYRGNRGKRYSGTCVEGR